MKNINSNWRKVIASIGVAASDSAMTAVSEELSELDLAPLTEAESIRLHNDLCKVVRLTVRSRLIPKTYMDC